MSSQDLAHVARQDPTASQAFVHKPLSSARSFRVLELLPSRDFDSTVSCEIREESLDGHVKYEALSYVWGAPTPGFSVSVDNKTLAVTPNCLEALRHLRFKFRRRFVWIDAICIDQGRSIHSTKERNHQVALMGEVYSEAQAVLVWLGASDDTTARTFRRLKLIAKLQLAAAPQRPSKLSPLAQLLARWVGQPMLEPDERSYHPRYQAMILILRHDWWYRAWTFQEQALARRCMVHQGRQRIPLMELMRGIYQRNIHELAIRETYFAPAMAERYVYDLRKHHLKQPSRSGQDRAARRLLSYAFSMQSTLPVDRIYGLHSLLVSTCDLPLPLPDYSKAFEDVFEETVWAWILSRQDLSIIQTAARPTHFQNLPSWVPAYHLGHERLQISSESEWPQIFHPSPAFQRFSWDSSGRNDLHYYMGHAEVEYSPKTLRAKGRYIGKLAFTRGDNRPDIDHGQAKHLDWCRHVSDLVSRGSLGHDGALREMYDTIMFSYYPDLTWPDYKDGGLSAFRVWFDVMIGRTPWPAGLPEETPLIAAFGDNAAIGPSLEWWNLPLFRVRHYAFCVLDNGMMAMANHWCEVGDEVFLLRGADCPFVLRREGASYRLVGPAYVHRVYQAQPWRFDGDDVQDITLV